MQQYAISERFRWAALGMAVALGLAACTTVDLNQRPYDPPVVEMPGSAADDAAKPGADGDFDRGVVTHPVDASDPDSAAGQDLHKVTLAAPLSPAEAVPPAGGQAEGEIYLLYDSGTGLLRWKASWSGLSGAITAIHYHGPATEGQTAPAVMIWPGPFGSAYEGRATLTPEQAADLIAGYWYVNVQTSRYPQGELRGQLLIVN